MEDQKMSPGAAQALALVALLRQTKMYEAAEAVHIIATDVIPFHLDECKDEDGAWEELNTLRAMIADGCLRTSAVKQAIRLARHFGTDSARALNDEEA